MVHSTNDDSDIALTSQLNEPPFVNGLLNAHTLPLPIHVQHDLQEHLGINFLNAHKYTMVKILFPHRYYLHTITLMILWTVVLKHGI